MSWVDFLIGLHFAIRRLLSIASVGLFAFWGFTQVGLAPFLIPHAMQPRTKVG